MLPSTVTAHNFSTSNDLPGDGGAVLLAGVMEDVAHVGILIRVLVCELADIVYLAVLLVV